MNIAAQFDKREKRNRIAARAVVITFAVIYVWIMYNSKFELQNLLWSIIFLLLYIMYRLYILDQLMLKTLRETKSK